jgi:coniferyl-aldehyde dehydrogenase
MSGRTISRSAASARGGMGKYHGIEGFRTLSHPKGIFVQGRWNGINLLRAPFGKRADALLSFFLR